MAQRLRRRRLGNQDISSATAVSPLSLTTNLIDLRLPGLASLGPQDQFVDKNVETIAIELHVDPMPARVSPQLTVVGRLRLRIDRITFAWAGQFHANRRIVVLAFEGHSRSNRQIALLGHDSKPTRTVPASIGFLSFASTDCPARLE